MKDIVAIVLAAGRGTRMKSDTPKVLHELLGKPMISHILDSIRTAGVNDIIAVTGSDGPSLKEVLKGTKVIAQKKLLGSGDAVNSVKKFLKCYSGNILIVYGDTPLIRYETIKLLIAQHKSSGASATILTAVLNDPRGYGRIARDDDERIVKIVEEDEASLYEEVIKEVNVGVYCFRAPDLFEALLEVKPENKKKEYYLTDMIGILHKKGRRIESQAQTDADETIGVNTRVDLQEANRLLKERILKEKQSFGVTIQDAASTTIYPDVKIGTDTVIYPHTIIESNVRIGRGCHIGPFAHIRPDVDIGDRVEIGNFVELVRTRVGDDTRIKHHTYMGDAVIGKRVNVGAGTITANFDGKGKFRTVIDDGAFIGVGAILIAPLRIGTKAIVGAGCVVPKNHDVPKGATVVGVPARILKIRKKRRSNEE